MKSKFKKHKVLYFTMVPLTYPSGGGICCYNHVRRLSSHPDLELTIVTMGSCKFEAEEREKVSKLRLKHYYIQTEGSIPRSNKWPNKLRFEQEKYALRSSTINEQVQKIISEYDFDTIFIDYLFSILFAPDLLLQPAQKILISLNKEAEFFRESMEDSTGFEYFCNLIKQWRIERFERNVLNSVDKVVFLSQKDFPGYPLKSKPYVVTPAIDDSKVSWSYTGSKKVLFVGSIDHSPNKKAVGWLCDQLAPQLEALKQSVKIIIVSRIKDTSRKELPENVEWLSNVDNADLEALMTSSDLFISPIENDFGVKFKLLECISHGTPFLASAGCLCGLPYLSEQSPLDLANPQKAAQIIVDHLSNRSLLENLSSEQKKKERAFRNSNENIWYQVIMDNMLEPTEAKNAIDDRAFKV